MELWSLFGEVVDWFVETFRSEGGEVVLDKVVGRSIVNEFEV